MRHFLSISTQLWSIITTINDNNYKKVLVIFSISKKTASPEFFDWQFAVFELPYGRNPLLGVSFTFGTSGTTSLLATASCSPCCGSLSFANSS